MPKEQSEQQADPSQANDRKAPITHKVSGAKDSGAAQENAGDSAGVAQPTLSLQDMSRIMEVASTLRKERTSAQKQLNLSETKALLRERLLQTTKVTGEQLTPAEIDMAIEQYYDNLHTFEEPPWSFSRVLAHLYVRRATLLKWLLATVAVIGLVAAWMTGKAALERQRAENLWGASDQHAQAIVAMAGDPQLATSLQAKVSQAAKARDRHDFGQLETIEAELAKLQALYEADYQVEILNEQGAKSATERKFTDEHGVRTSGFYVIVQARNKDGSVRKMAIRNRETDKMEQVTRWGEQIPESVFNRLAADKRADGVLDEKLFSIKRQGLTDETMVLPGDDGQPIQRRGQITSW